MDRHTEKWRAARGRSPWSERTLEDALRDAERAPEEDKRNRQYAPVPESEEADSRGSKNARGRSAETATSPRAAF